MTKELPEIRLENLYPPTEFKIKTLYELLLEREPYESISHTGVPTYEEHKKFIMTHPHAQWYIVYNDRNEPIGSFYTSYRLNEVGIAIFKNYRRKGYATAIIQKIISTNGDLGIIANINPANIKSIELFKKLGFVHIQNTYRYKT